jgi:actin-related protein
MDYCFSIVKYLTKMMVDIENEEEAQKTEQEEERRKRELEEKRKFHEEEEKRKETRRKFHEEEEKRKEEMRNFDKRAHARRVSLMVPDHLKLKSMSSPSLLTPASFLGPRSNHPSANQLVPLSDSDNSQHFCDLMTAIHNLYYNSWNQVYKERL